MSTILRALQKQNGYLKANSEMQNSDNHTSKLLIIGIAFLLGIVILLASLLIFNQLKIAEPTAPKAIKVKPIKPAKMVEKLVFNTQKIPSKMDDTYLPKAPKKVVPIKVRIVNNKVSVIKPVKEIEPSTEATENKTDELQVSELSQKLKDQFAQAIAQTDDEIEIESNNQTIKNDGLQSADGQDIHDMASGFQQKVAPMSYDAHVYSSNVANRWIKINGQKLHEGDKTSNGIEVLEIKPYKTIFRLDGQSFSLESLLDWKG